MADARRITREHLDDWTRKAKPSANDVILSRRCNPGETAFVPPNLDFALGQNLVLLRADGTKVFPSFLRWLVRGPEWWEQIGKFLNVGAVFDSLRCADVPNFELHIPSLPEQHAISHILGTLDDKISVNRKMNETLEAMARALFKSWFIDFDPVRAKKEGRWKRGQSLPGLPAHLYDLFPKEFEDSELGEIPKGWEVKTLFDIATVITKGTTPTQEDIASTNNTDTQVNYIRVNAIDEDGAILYDKLISIPETVHFGVLKRSVLQANDILYTIAGTVGRIAITEDWILPANTNQAVAIVRPKPSVPPNFLVLTMQHDGFRQDLHSNIVHAVQANLSLGMLAKARVVIPPQTALQDIFKPIDEMQAKLSANRSQSRTLAALRDTLLPKLLSGELGVAANPSGHEGSI